MSLTKGDREQVPKMLKMLAANLEADNIVAEDLSLTPEGEDGMLLAVRMEVVPGLELDTELGK